MVKSYINSSTGDPCYCRQPCVQGKRYCHEHQYAKTESDDRRWHRFLVWERWN
jgi:hypothetical protein